MRIIFIYTSIFVVNLFLTIAYSQSPDLDKKITIIARDVPLSDILEQLSKKGVLNFSFTPEQLPLDAKITVIARKKSIKNILDQISEDMVLEYKLVEKHIILKPQKNNEIQNISENEKAEKRTKSGLKKYTISGYLKDEESGESLPGATIWVQEMLSGTSANAYGFYSLTLPEGEYNIRFSSVGYKSDNTKINLKNHYHFNSNLPVNSAILTEVAIVASDQENHIDEIQMSQTKLETTSIGKMPGFMGEVELIKALQSVPGIKTYGDGSVYFYVRGGSKDQNMILIDEAPIYNPSHLFGFFSSITPDAIKDARIYKGNIPINYGGALSSLTDIRTKDGNMNKYGAYGSIGLMTNRFSVEGPIKKEKSSFFVSIRRSHLKWLVPKSIRKNSTIRFYDFNTKLNFIINADNRLYLSLYSGKDFYTLSPVKAGSFGIKWGNTAATLRWNHLFSDKLFSNTTVYVSKYYYDLITSIENNRFWNETITNLSLKSDFTYYFNHLNTVKFGIKHTNHFFNPGNFESGIPENLSKIPKIAQQKAKHLVIYSGNEQKINEKFALQYGLRLNVWKNAGPTEVYMFDDNYLVADTLVINNKKTYNKYINLEPSIGMKYTLNSSSSLKASYGRTYQYLQLLSNSTSPFTSLDIWLPSSPNIKPQMSDQVVAGYGKAFNNHNMDIGAEVYYKQMYNQIDYNDHANMLLNPLVEGELRFGSAWSYGLELYVRKMRGRFNWLISYTLSKTMMKIKDLNNDQSYPAFQDRPHDFTLSLAWESSKRWGLSAGWIYATGAPVTVPTGFYYYQGVTVPVYGSRHNSRLPDYHRLDISATVRLNKKTDRKFSHSLTFSLYNAYNRKNPIAVNFNKTEAEDGKFKVPANLLIAPELLKTELSLLGVIPSVNYIFQF